ncbi:MAG: aromatic ring-hydroxylating dioxygenase subunit alpha [Gemmatimonadetes bacterium]|nr:aromatic ring-hydroxylating dioxygenase subunit alpha [Gemmatimonadota bacterium]
MRQALVDRPQDASLPGRFYTDPRFCELDLAHLFYREWIFAGHSGEIARPGDRFTLQIGDYPVLVVRGHDGVPRGFHNVCRHRGQVLCSGATGSGRKLVCPYHQWTYELDGRLSFARDMMAEIDASRFALSPIACEEVAGYLFVCLSPTPPDFAPFRDAVEPYLAPHRLARAKVAFQSTIVERANWKLVVENNRECYHCSSNHPELCRVYSARPVMSNAIGQPQDEAVDAHWRRWESKGLPSGFRIAADGQFRTVRLPFLGDAESMTADGRPGCRRPLADFPEPGLGSMLLFHYPSTWNHVLADHAVSFRLLPRGPNETELTTKWLVHAEAQEGVDYQVDHLTRVWVATNDEDRSIVESNQRGVSSPAYQPGPLSRIHESGVTQFLDWYAATMGERLESSVPSR